jgi:hypothetical protein
METDRVKDLNDRVSDALFDVRSDLPYGKSVEICITVRGFHGHDRMIVGFTTACVISVCHQ